MPDNGASELSYVSSLLESFRLVAETQRDIEQRSGIMDAVLIIQGLSVNIARDRVATPGSTWRDYMANLTVATRGLEAGYRTMEDHARIDSSYANGAITVCVATRKGIHSYYHPSISLRANLEPCDCDMCKSPQAIATVDYE